MKIQAETRSFYRMMLRLAVPIALQNLLTSCAQLVDTAMVVGIGNTATAAVGVAARWGFLFHICLFGIASGCATLAAQAWGAKDEAIIRKTYGAGLSLSLLLGLLYNLAAFCIPQYMLRVFTADADVIVIGAQYLRYVSFYGLFVAFCMVSATLLRAMENVMTPLICATISVFTDSFLNYVLIYGKFGLPAMGVRGAALSTSLAAVLQAVCLLALGIHKRALIFSKMRSCFCLSRDFLQRFFRLMLPTLGNELSWATGTNIYAMVLARQGSDNFAAYTIFGSVEQLSFILFIGICHACSVMVGKTIGEERLQDAYALSRRFMKLMPLLGLAGGTLLALAQFPLVRILPIETQEVRKLVSALLLVYSCWMPFRPIPYIAIVGIFRAGGDTKTGMYYDSICLYLISIPVVVLLGFYTNIPFWMLIAALYLCEDSLKIVLCVRHFRTRRWIRQLTF